MIRLISTTLPQNVSFLATIATATTRMHCGLPYVLHITISSLCAEAVGTMVQVLSCKETSRIGGIVQCC